MLTMLLTEWDKNVIKEMQKEKSYSLNRTLNEFQNKNQKEYLLQKVSEKSWLQSGRPKSIRITDIEKVSELALSQQDKLGMQAKASVKLEQNRDFAFINTTIIQKDLGYKIFKRVKVTSLSEKVNVNEEHKQIYIEKNAFFFFFAKIRHLNLLKEFFYEKRFTL